MQNFGGGIMNENAVQRQYPPSSCGPYSYIEYPGTNVIEYNIWYDLQGGCNVIMYMNGNTSPQGVMITYNKLFRAKKNAASTQYFRNTDYTATPLVTNYQKDNVYRLWFVKTDYYTTHCADGSGGTSYRLLQNGYQVIDGSYQYYPTGAYDYSFPKGTTVATTGNINVAELAVAKRTYINNTLSNFSVLGYGLKEEKYDSIPYQRASSTDPEIGYNTVEPPMNSLNNFRDTLLAESIYSYDFSLASGGNQIYSSALVAEPGLSNGNRTVRLQHLAVEQKTLDSFAIVYKTNLKQGVLIGKDIQNFFFGGQYDIPLLTVNNSGNALFYIKENNGNSGPVRVSPVFTGAELAWGAMGRAIGTGVFNGSYYNMDQPFAALDPVNGSAGISWKDNRNSSTTSDDIFIQHLDSLNRTNYYPPVKRIRLIPNPYTATSSNPLALFGSSKRYSLFETYAPYGTDIGVTPVAEIKDDNYFGSVTVRVFQSSGSIRAYNGRAYLDRNFTIFSDSIPPNSNFNIRLYFTKTEFNALKANDNTIITPADLVVIKQPHNTSAYPDTYAPLANEQLLTPIAWDSVANGYYVEVRTNSFGDFFIQKSTIAALCPGGSTAIISNLTGSTYQWKVNNGSGFVNVINNANYSGATSATLQLNNIPTTFAGYQYLCVVNGGTNSAVTTLHFINTWSGAVNNNWENAANWSCGSVPDANTDVVLIAGTVVVNSNATCRSLTTNVGVSFTVSVGYIFTVTH
ncbi:MAG: hypothetical protein H0W12_02900 [Chitinophagaceae bacterium]|nr:hypothetical protein [Chitinophagaceae bacterium]